MIPALFSPIEHIRWLWWPRAVLTSERRGGNVRQSVPEHLIFCPPCRAASSWSIGWLDREKIQISATFPSMSFWLLQRGRTWPPSVGCCITWDTREQRQEMRRRRNVSAQWDWGSELTPQFILFSKSSTARMISAFSWFDTTFSQRYRALHLQQTLFSIKHCRLRDAVKICSVQFYLNVAIEAEKQACTQLNTWKQWWILL